MPYNQLPTEPIGKDIELGPQPEFEPIETRPYAVAIESQPAPETPVITRTLVEIVDGRRDTSPSASDMCVGVTLLIIILGIALLVLRYILKYQWEHD